VKVAQLFFQTVATDLTDIPAKIQGYEGEGRFLSTIQTTGCRPIAQL
jgi:hypothetical protein